ncbi:MAG: rhombosortase [Nitrospirota bacterium]
MNARLPLVTIPVLLLSTACYITPDLAALMIYDRQAILNGEYWRLLSGHFVHFSGTHLTYDLFAFGIVGWIIESKGERYLGLLCLLMALSISTFLFITRPDMRYYGGLSGLACGCISYLALTGIYGKMRQPALYALVLLCLITKTGAEVYYGHSLLPYPGELSFVPEPMSHLIGIMTIIIFITIRTVKRSMVTVVRMYNTPKDMIQKFHIQCNKGFSK